MIEMTCENCSAAGTLIPISADDELLLVVDDETEVEVMAVPEGVMACSSCDHVALSEAQELAVAPALADTQKGWGIPRKIGRWLRRPRPPRITLPSSGGRSKDPPKPHQYVHRVGGERCGPLHTPEACLKNLHKKRVIRVHVEITAEHSSEPPVKRHYDVPPNSVVPMGCPVPGPTLQRMIYKPVAYEWR